MRLALNCRTADGSWLTRVGGKSRELFFLALRLGGMPPACVEVCSGRE
jgi:hypothetical protein